MNNFIKNLFRKFSDQNLTDSSGKVENSQTREVLARPTREVSKPAIDSLACPYCLSAKFQKRGFRQKKHERVQLYLCLSCRKTFTPQITKGKHYPLAVILDAISIYNLGYSLEETCRIMNQRIATKKSALADLVRPTISRNGWLDTLNRTLTDDNNFVKSQNDKRDVDPPGVEPGRHGVSSQPSEPAEPTSTALLQETTEYARLKIQPSTLSTWVTETEPLCRYCQMRPYVTQKYQPRDVVIHATLAHRQLYRYRYHRGKCELLINHEYRHRRFNPLREFLELVPGECPHQYFQEGLRASEAPLAFSKTQMIVRAKQNYATRLCEFVLQSVKDRRARHEVLQKFMLANDSVTVATEVPVYITNDDLEHMQTQLGFKMYVKSAGAGRPLPKLPDVDGRIPAEVVEMAAAELPSLITGHIDILQIRNGMVHILDYKPKAEKERPIEQLTLYAMALSRLTGLRLFEFKCAWFDEKDYFEFFPLHVLYKPAGRRRRKNVATKEGQYKINQNWRKIDSVRPEAI